MFPIRNNDNRNTNFSAKVKLSDKKCLNVTHNLRTIDETSSFDFFYSESKLKRIIENGSERVRAYIRGKQQNNTNSEFKKKFFRKSYDFANYLRVLSSKILIIGNSRRFIKAGRILEDIDVNSPRYINELAKLGNSVTGKYININIEDGIIEKLAKEGDGSIFILNHDNVERDKFIYPIFNSFLNYAYAAMGLQKDCPRPAILVSSNVLKFTGKKFREIYSKMGLIPVDASMTERVPSRNVNPIRHIADDFSKGKVNLFIFPEGNNSVYKNRTLKEKFQTGTAKLITFILRQCPRVRVVPLGIAYDFKAGSMGGLHIGEPLIFKRIPYGIICEQENKPSTLIGEKATAKITDILCENLQKNINKSKDNLFN